MIKMLRMLAPVLALTMMSPDAPGQKVKHGILDQQAPGFEVKEWINLPRGKKTIDIDDFHGKVLYLYCFQSWCPGCHSHGFPTLQKLIKKYRKADDVEFVVVQTVFEGFSTNTVSRAWQTAKQYDLDIPVGHDGSEGKRSVLMGRYRTGGTPWTVIIDREGKVRWNDFHPTAEEAGALIDRLREEPVPVKTLPASRGGQDVVGKDFPELSFDRRLNSPRKTDGSKKTAKVTLYRWWTDRCPYCKASLPAIDKLRRKYKDKGLVVVAVYHPKPPREVEDKAITGTARQLGYRGPIAVDLDWSELERFYLSTGKRSATSVSFLVDKGGVIRFVHPGPMLFPSKDAKHAQENADFELLERAIQVLLEEERR